MSHAQRDQAGSATYRSGDHEIAFEAMRGLPTALLVVAASGVTLLANRRACDVLERSRADIEGAAVASFLAPIETLLSPESRDERSAKRTVTLPSGRVTTIGFDVGELRSGIAGLEERLYCIVLKDISEAERLREERNRLLQIATVHDLLPSILHEVKNPLAAIATTAELMMEEAVDEHTRTSAHAILHETRRMKLTLQGIGAVGRGLRSTHHEPIDHAIREAWTVLRARAVSVGVAARCVVPDLPLLPLDSSVICALVFNLVNNAVQACSAGGEVLLSAALDEGGRSLSIRVDDTGSGMSPDVLSRCREIFFTTRARGTGIGLALCDRALTDAGGTMTIDSALGHGTRITLRIPLDTP